MSEVGYLLASYLLDFHIQMHACCLFNKHVTEVFSVSPHSSCASIVGYSGTVPLLVLRRMTQGRY